jgi:hypothetical protein
MSDNEITVENMLDDDPELTEDDFPIFDVTEDPYGFGCQPGECPWCGTINCTGSPCDYSSFDARSDEILERTHGLGSDGFDRWGA